MTPRLRLVAGLTPTDSSLTSYAAFPSLSAKESNDKPAQNGGRLGCPDFAMCKTRA
jgi:hypothetical protein